MDRLLFIFLRRFIRRGSFTVTTAAGSTYTFGDGSGPPVAVRFTTAKAQRAVLLDPELKLGEAYMDGTLVVEQGSIADVLAILLRQERDRRAELGCCRGSCATCSAACSNSICDPARATTSRITTTSTAGSIRSSSTATSNIAAPISNSPDQSLDDAQLAKKRHLAAKLRLKPGATVLGHRLRLGRPCALSRRDCRRAGHRHHAIAGAIPARAKPGAGARPHAGRDVPAGGLSRCRRPFRSHRLGRHVRACRRRLLRHLLRQMREAPRRRRRRRCCTRSAAAARPGITNPWIAKYIFPGGYIPALSEVLPAIERARLIVTDVEILQLHYAETLKAWRERFLAHRDEVVRLYDQRFVRMWEFYLACSEMAFREGDMVVFQIQMAKRKGVTPATRDYIAREEARLRAHRSRLFRAAATRRRIGRRGAARRNAAVKCRSRLSSFPQRRPVGNGESRNEDFPLRAPLDYRQRAWLRDGCAAEMCRCR